MRFLVDAQLPPALARRFQARGYESKAVREIGLREADDTAVSSFAAMGGWGVVTKDEDFAAHALQSPSWPHVLWLRIGNGTNRILMAWLEPLLDAALRDLAAGHRVVELQRPIRGGSAA